MSLPQSPAGDVFSSASRTPAPTVATPDSDADDSDFESVAALQGEDSVKLRKLRSPSEKRKEQVSGDHEDYSSEEESVKERIGPVRRVGTRSKEYTDQEETA